jgi:hypothetical protein
MCGGGGSRKKMVGFILLKNTSTEIVDENGTRAEHGEDGARKRFLSKTIGVYFPDSPLIVVSHADVICCAFTENY